MLLLPGQKKLIHLLVSPLGEPAASQIVHAAAGRYPALLAACPPSPDPVRLTKQVLPILALYQVLQSQGMARAEALAILEPVVLEAYFGFLRQGLAAFGRLPINTFSILRPALQMMARPVNERSGRVIEDNPQRLVVHTYVCPILEALKTYDAPELTVVFCASDDWLAATMPRIRWLRTTTLGRGGAQCDFHWERS